MRRVGAALTSAASRAAGAAARPATSSAAAPGDYRWAAGVPDHLLQREVVVYAPARTASQQGMSQTASPMGKGGAWRIEFETKPKWVNPLMGWTSTADPYENVGRQALSFDTRDAALAFCAKHGWRATVKPAPLALKQRPARFLQYGDNFSVKRKGTPVGGLVSETMGKAAAAKKAAK